MGKRLSSLLTLAVLAWLAVPVTVSAHVLRTDGDIGAVLHINPDDNPTAGDPTDYVISFADDTGKFSLSQCLCSVAVMQAGRTITRRSLAHSQGAVSENRYTFVRPAVYTLRVTGMPRTPGAFQPFTLDYEVRVTSGQSAMQPVPPLLWAGMGLGLGLILLAAYASDYTDGETEK